jgi:hypothetical protein
LKKCCNPASHWKVLACLAKGTCRGCHQIEMAFISIRSPGSIFFGIMCKGDAHGNFERQTMLADSKRLNSAFAVSIFPDPGDGILQKLGDDCLCECGAPPHGLGWASHHPCAKWKGIFLSKHFMSSWTESGIFCVTGMETDGSTRGKTLGQARSPAAGAFAIQANST